MINWLQKTVAGLMLVVWSSGYCYSFTAADAKAEVSLEMAVLISVNPNPVFLAVEQTDYIRTQADGFSNKEESDTDRYRMVGSTYLTWQARGAYEIIIYTDNINTLGLSAYMPGETAPIATKVNFVDTFSGLHALYPWPVGVIPWFWPIKVWVPKTAGLVNIGTPADPEYVVQETAPVNPDGTIDSEYFNGGTTYNPEASFGYIPEKLAIDASIGLYGSYKKVIASTQDKTWPSRIELTFAVDLANSNLDANESSGFNQYEGTIIIHLIGN